MRDSRLKPTEGQRAATPALTWGKVELERGFRPYEKPEGIITRSPDYYEEKHGRMIAKQYGNLPLCQADPVCSG